MPVILIAPMIRPLANKLPVATKSFAVIVPVATKTFVSIFETPVIVPPVPEPRNIAFAVILFAVTFSVTVILPCTVPVVIPTNTLAFVKYKLVNSVTLAVVNLGLTACNTRTLVKY